MMTEEWLIKELDSATKQLNMWWNTAIKPDSYPKRLQGKILFLRGYLKALKSVKDDKIVGDALNELKEEFWRKRFFTPTIRPKENG